MNIENLKPLTLEQLREMDGKPVWLHTFSSKTKKTNISEWALVASSGEYSVSFVRVAVCGRFEKRCEDYGKTWVAYAYPPVYIDRSKWEPCKLCSLPDGRSAYRLILAETCGGEARFCPECGRPLTDEAWAELERRLTNDKRG